MRTAFNKRLEDLKMPIEFRQWAEGKTAQQAYEQCERGDWFISLFFIENFMETNGFPDTKQITKVKVKCAELIIDLMEDERSRNALKIAWAWSNNEATDEELKVAAIAAEAAAAHIIHSEKSFSKAFLAAKAAVYSAFKEVGSAVEDVVSEAHGNKSEVLKKCADIVREYLKLPKDYCTEKPDFHKKEIIHSFLDELKTAIEYGKTEDYTFDGEDEYLVETFDSGQSINAVVKLLCKWKIFPEEVIEIIKTR